MVFYWGVPGKLLTYAHSPPITAGGPTHTRVTARPPRSNAASAGSAAGGKGGRRRLAPFTETPWPAARTAVLRLS